VSADREIQLAVEVHISDCEFVGRMRQADRVGCGSELSITFTEQNGNAATPSARHDEIRIFIVIDVADDYIARPGRD